MNSQSLGLAHMLSNADAVIWFTAITLLVMSIVSWTLIIAKGRVAQRLRRQIAQSAAAFWSAQDLTAGLATLKQREAQPALSLIAQAAVEVEQQASGLSLNAQSLREDRVTRALRGALHQARVGLESGLVTLASIGATAPFVGLFGTVWSIYQALVGISGSGQVMIEQVAGPVGEALIMTAFGLFVAIPAVLAYNALTRSNRVIVAELDGFANDVRAFVLGRNATA